jgi:hypothetical protein
MNSINIPFIYTINELNNRNKSKLNFIDSLVRILLKGYNTDTNCAIVMGMVGAVVGMN